MNTTIILDILNWNSTNECECLLSLSDKHGTCHELIFFDLQHTNIIITDELSGAVDISSCICMRETGKEVPYICNPSKFELYGLLNTSYRRESISCFETPHIHEIPSRHSPVNNEEVTVLWLLVIIAVQLLHATLMKPNSKCRSRSFYSRQRVRQPLYSVDRSTLEEISGPYRVLAPNTNTHLPPPCNTTLLSGYYTDARFSESEDAWGAVFRQIYSSKSIIPDSVRGNDSYDFKNESVSTFYHLLPNLSEQYSASKTTALNTSGLSSCLYPILPSFHIRYFPSNGTYTGDMNIISSSQTRSYISNAPKQLVFDSENQTTTVTAVATLSCLCPIFPSVSSQCPPAYPLTCCPKVYIHTSDTDPMFCAVLVHTLPNHPPCPCFPSVANRTLDYKKSLQVYTVKSIPLWKKTGPMRWAPIHSHDDTARMQNRM